MLYIYVSSEQKPDLNICCLCPWNDKCKVWAILALGLDTLPFNIWNNKHVAVNQIYIQNE